MSRPESMMILLLALWTSESASAQVWLEEAVHPWVERPEALEIADVDGDGDADVLVMDGGRGWIGWLVQTEAGYVAREVARPREAVEAVVPLDLDCDGDLDVAWSDADIHARARVRANLGGLRFGEERSHSGVYVAEDLDSGDLDGDGRPDLLSTRGELGGWSWHRNRGDGTFELHEIDDNTLTTRLRAVDVDSDGVEEVVSLHGSTAWVSWTADGELLPEVLERFPGANDLAAADLDGDGLAEVAVSLENRDRVEVVEYAGAEGWLVVDEAIVFAPMQVEVAQLDGMGSLDLVVVSDAPPEVQWVSRGLDGWNVDVVASPGARPSQVAVGDIDGDGADDVALAVGQRVSVVRNGGRGSFAEEEILAGPAFGAHALDVGDLDGDGDPDLVLASRTADTLLVAENVPEGFVAHAIGDVGELSVVTTLDADGDGDLDIAAGARFRDTLTLYENLGDGTFALSTSIVPGVSALAAADVDGDGDEDLVTVGDDGDRLGWMENVGGPSLVYGAEPGSDLPAGAWEVATGDLDDDGDVDLVLAETRGTLGLWLNDGAGAFSRVPLDEIRPQGVEVGDIDGDGRLDVLAMSDDGNLGLYRGLGGGSFAPREHVGSMPGGRSLALGDRDGDGDLDILAGTAGAGAPSFDQVGWLVQDEGSFAMELVDEGRAGGESLAALDVDGDGLLEVAVAWAQEGGAALYRDCGPDVDEDGDDLVDGCDPDPGRAGFELDACTPPTTPDEEEPEEPPVAPLERADVRGCTCAAAGPGAGAWLLLVAVGGCVRRRRHRP